LNPRAPTLSLGRTCRSGPFRRRRLCRPRRSARDGRPDRRGPELCLGCRAPKPGYPNLPIVPGEHDESRIVAAVAAIALVPIPVPNIAPRGGNGRHRRCRCRRADWPIAGSVIALRPTGRFALKDQASHPQKYALLEASLRTVREYPTPAHTTCSRASLAGTSASRSPRTRALRMADANAFRSCCSPPNSLLASPGRSAPSGNGFANAALFGLALSRI
jgi:hypothetical protein